VKGDDKALALTYLGLQVLVYNFGDLKLLHQIETLANPRGLVAISSAAESTVLAAPGLHTGQVSVLPVGG